MESALKTTGSSVLYLCIEYVYFKERLKYRQKKWEEGLLQTPS